MAHELSQNELDKLVELARVKRLATIVLVLCFVVMVLTKIAEARWPEQASWLSFVSAFAEAATIGGIADWYAVVALFKRPMNLPIPHTAIIPNNQARIGDNLGRFIEKNFLSKETIGSKLAEIKFADEIAKWLSTPAKSEELAQFAAKLIPQLLDAIDHTGMKTFAANRVQEQLAKTEVAPIAARLLDSFVNDGSHQKLMNDLIAALHKFINDDVALEAIRLKVHDELPSMFNFFRTDALILRRIVKAGSALLDEVKNDPEHEMRAEFEKFLKDYVRRIKRSKRFANRVEEMKRDILARPEFADIAERLWKSLRKYLKDDVKKDDSATVRRLTSMFVDIGKNLKKEKALKKEIDSEMVRILSSLIEKQKSGVSKYVSEQVKAWDFAQLTLLIEANIGKDLQYIRFNGMVIGGIAGVILHSILLLVG